MSTEESVDRGRGDQRVVPAGQHDNVIDRGVFNRHTKPGKGSLYVTPCCPFRYVALRGLPRTGSGPSRAESGGRHAEMSVGAPVRTQACRVVPDLGAPESRRHIPSIGTLDDLEATSCRDRSGELKLTRLNVARRSQLTSPRASTSTTPPQTRPPANLHPDPGKSRFSRRRDGAVWSSSIRLYINSPPARYTPACGRRRDAVQRGRRARLRARGQGDYEPAAQRPPRGFSG